MTEFSSFVDDAMEGLDDQLVDCQNPHMPAFTSFFDDAMDSLGDQWADCESPHMPEDWGKDFSGMSWNSYCNQDLDAGPISFPNSRPSSSLEVSSIVEPTPLDITGSNDSQLPWNLLCLDTGPDTFKEDSMLLTLSDKEQLAHVMTEFFSLQAENKFLKTLLAQSSSGKGVSGKSKARKTIQRSKNAISGKTPRNEQGSGLRRSKRKRPIPNYRQWTWLPGDECIVIDD
ncbi:hypothetical protein BDV18DRAFT_156013 [Aspergillus unguis]